MQLLLNRYICLPCGNRPITVAQKFQQQQWLPQVGGAVDEVCQLTNSSADLQISFPLGFRVVATNLGLHEMLHLCITS